MADKNETQNHSASMVYRGADGRPHIVPAQEEAARAAQRSETKPVPTPDLPGLATRTPD